LFCNKEAGQNYRKLLNGRTEAILHQFTGWEKIFFHSLSGWGKLFATPFLPSVSRFLHVNFVLSFLVGVSWFRKRAFSANRALEASGASNRKKCFLIYLVKQL
jgi:hypothetical protein